jgi:hypothetical protein
LAVLSMMMAVPCRLGMAFINPGARVSAFSQKATSDMWTA